MDLSKESTLIDKKKRIDYTKLENNSADTLLSKHPPLFWLEGKEKYNIQTLYWKEDQLHLFTLLNHSPPGRTFRSFGA